MLKVHLIVVGKLKEKFFLDASDEYIKRLGGYCNFTLTQIPEEKLPSHPSEREILAALHKEGGQILSKVPSDSALIPLCVEGKTLSSQALATQVQSVANGPMRHLVFVIGGSYGLSDDVKSRATLKLSLSPMTFPHHLARVILLEQIYRAFKIIEGSSYHK
ncbi:MAG: 23S rRNA (pseudouridine(1915)-N(3))-methyltransferase RlmH [Eubacteriales bacterium]